ncbi:MAG: winged helix-turn-helix domain-containing protein [Myxococcota bacterium]
MIRLGRFFVDLEAETLLDDGQPKHLRPAAWRLLAVFVERPGALWSHDELIARVWPGLSVVNDVLTQQVGALRRRLGREAIATIRGRGYRFELPVSDASAAKRIPKLIGRESIVQELIAALQSHGSACLYGVPGIGKSAVAELVAARWTDPSPLHVIDETQAVANEPCLFVARHFPPSFSGATIRLEGLPPPAGRELLRRTVPPARASDEDLEALSKRFGGHPGALVALAGPLRVWPTSELDASALPADIVEAFEDGFASLSPAVQHSFRRLAGLQTAIPASLARSSLTELPPGTVQCAPLERTAASGWLDVDIKDGSSWVRVGPPMGDWVRAHHGAIDAPGMHQLAAKWLIDRGQSHHEAARRTPDTPSWTWLFQHHDLLIELLTTGGEHLSADVRCNLALMAQLRPRHFGSPERALELVRLGLDADPTHIRLRRTELSLLRLTQRLEEALQAARSLLADVGDDALTRLHVQCELATLQAWSAPELASKTARETLHQALRVNDPFLIARAHFTCARTLPGSNSAIEHYRAALARLPDPNGWQGQAIRLNLGHAEHEWGHLEEAEAHYLARLDVPEHRDSRESRIKTLQCLSDAMREQGRTDEAEHWLGKSLNMATNAGWIGLSRASELGLAGLAIDRANLEDAQQWLDRRPANHEPDDRSRAMRSLLQALMALRSGQIRKARLYLMEAPHMAIAGLDAVRLALLAGSEATLGNPHAACAHITSVPPTLRTAPALRPWFAWAEAAVALAREQIGFPEIEASLRGYGTSNPDSRPVPELRWLTDVLRGAPTAMTASGPHS